MKLVKTILALLLGVFMIYGGVSHLVKPDFFLPFVPYFLPFREVIVTLSGIALIGVGAGVFVPRFRKCSAVAVLALMVLFLPVHLWDVFRSDPAIGSHTAALVRVPFQLLFIAWAYWIASPCGKCSTGCCSKKIKR
jgi:uncharacterized membrane protein